MSHRDELAAGLTTLVELSKRIRTLISVCLAQDTNKRDRDMLARVFDELLDAEIVIAKLLK